MILVTGASGFLGGHLVRFLSEKGLSVRALYHSRMPDTVLPGVEWCRCDLLDIYDVAAVLAGITEIYHCAACVSFAGDTPQLYRVNVSGTAQLVNEALERGIRKLVFVSSIAALGRAAGKKPLTEDAVWEESRNNTAYARSKYLAETEVWRAMEEGLNAVIVNPAIILGSGDWQQGSAALMRVVDQELPFYTEGVNGWVDVADVVRAMVLLMDSDISAERFILSAGNYAYREVFGQMAAALGRKAPYILARPWMSGLLWRWNALKQLFTGRQSTITRETARTAAAICYYDNSRFLERFPSFRYTPLADTIQKMAAAYQARP